MGEMYAAVCPCGYQSHSLLEGSGMMRQGFGIYQCQRCHALLNSRDTTQQERCSSCASRKLTPIESEEGAALICPHCKENQLQLYECGLWD
ncbi:hypothetical protein [endosymbiont of Lamellibrachia barhami]|uniref:hypothetical protein n=1 Tax=endosymbiont of Lamellibrachia barhami TaxID=205975 RepID=UPI0015AEB8B6|nr:hypothetical protein [endosymbiont of Lamellibrachia barhami]